MPASSEKLTPGYQQSCDQSCGWKTSMSFRLLFQITEEQHENFFCACHHIKRRHNAAADWKVMIWSPELVTRLQAHKIFLFLIVLIPIK